MQPASGGGSERRRTAHLGCRENAPLRLGEARLRAE